jgi:ABC-type transporter Mla subunit MlaD
MRFEREDAKLGLLVLVAFALFAALAFQRTLRILFHPETVYAVRLANAAELEVGSEVQLLGLQVGEVRKIKMEREGTDYRFVGTFGLRRKVVLWRGTKGVVTARMVGGPFLDLRLPPVEQRLVALAPGETIEGEPGASAGTLVAELTDLTRNLNVTVAELRQELKTHGLASILEQPEIRKTLHEFGESLVAFRAASKATEETVAHGGRTLDTADRNLASLEKSLLVLQGLLERRGSELDTAAAQLGPALEKVQTAGSDVSKLLQSAGPEAAENLRALHRTLASVQELLELLKAKPNRIVFGKPSPQEREAARKKVAESEAAPARKPAEPPR